jgi:retinoid hydroxylase
LAHEYGHLLVANHPRHIVTADKTKTERFKMNDSTNKHAVPLGRKYLPVIGETLVFAKNGFAFIEDRVKSFGNVFRSHLLGKDTMVFSGPENVAGVIDDAYVMRKDAMPANIRDLFGGDSLPMLDGEIHRHRHALIRQAFTRDALESYLPLMQVTIEKHLEIWEDKGELVWLEELKFLTFEVICRTVIGLEPGNDLDQLYELYLVFNKGFASLPIAIPGTPYAKALKARTEICSVLIRLARERRTSPKADGMSRILQANHEGTTISDEEAVVEVLHLLNAGFVTFSVLVSLVMNLAQYPEVRSRLAAEVEAQSPEGELVLKNLDSLQYLSQVVKEAKRLCPTIPAIFNKVHTRFSLQSHEIPEGWLVVWSLFGSHMDPSVYKDPKLFDPDRFSPERAEDKVHPHAFVPHGPGGKHECVGIDYATYCMKVFAILLLRNYTWELPPQDLSYEWGAIPPYPKDKLQARFHSRT